MPRPRSAMRKIKEVLRLTFAEGLTRRRVGAAVGLPTTTVLSEKVGSKRGVSTWARACWISRSSAVGTPSLRSPPEGLGIITLRTGAGR